MKSRIHDWWQARRASCKLLQPIEKLDGLWAWVVCFASFGLFFCGAGVLYTFGVLYIGLLDYFADIKEMANVNQSCCTENSTQNRDLSAELAWIGSTSVLASSLPAPLIGSLVATIGVRPMIIIASILLILGQTLTSLSRDIWHPFVAYGILIGMSASIVYVVCWGVLPLYFEKRRSLACGVANCGKFLGMAFVGPMSRISMKRYGWRSTLQLFSTLGLLMLIPAIFYRPPKKTSEVDRVEQTAGFRQNLIKTLKLHRNPLFTFWLWVIALMHIAFFVPAYHIVRHAEDNLDISAERSGYLLTVMATSAAVSAMIVGLAADRIAFAYKILFIQVLLLLGGVSTMLLPYYQTYVLLAIYMIAYGLAMGFSALTPVISVEIVGEEHCTGALGLVTLYQLTVAVGPPIAGWMYDSAGTYNYSFLLFGSLQVLAALLLFIPIICRWAIRKNEQREKRHDSIQIENAK